MRPGTLRSMVASDSIAASFSSVLKMLNSVSSGVKASETSWVTISMPLASVPPASPMAPVVARLEDSSPTRIARRAFLRESRLLVKSCVTRKLEE